MAENSQADYANVPSRKKRRWATTTQKILFLLAGINMLGLVAERWSIHSLYEKMEVISLAMSHSVCQNLSDPPESVQQGVATITPVAPKVVTESSEILTAQPSLNRTEPVQQRPFAHLMGDNMSVRIDNTFVLQWRRRGGESVLSNMGYDNGRLLVQMEGYYYIYSKVTVNAEKECEAVHHKVLKVTQAYDKPIELMKSESFRCPKPPPESAEDPGENLWNSFLAGIFQLQSGDEIFVTLTEPLRPGNTENCMGAFMISA